MIFKKRRDEVPEEIIEEELAENEEHISRDDVDIEVVVAEDSPDVYKRQPHTTLKKD